MVLYLNSNCNCFVLFFRWNMLWRWLRKFLRGLRSGRVWSQGTMFGWTSMCWWPMMCAGRGHSEFSRKSLDRMLRLHLSSLALLIFLVFNPIVDFRLMSVISEYGIVAALLKPSNLCMNACRSNKNYFHELVIICLKPWRQILEFRDFILSGSKIEYMEYKFSKWRSQEYTVVLDRRKISIAIS